MKPILCVFLITWSFVSFAEVKLPYAIKTLICQETAASYPTGRDWGQVLFDDKTELEPHEFYVEINEELCENSYLKVDEQDHKKIGPQKYLVGMKISFQVDSARCRSDIYRKHAVDLKGDGTYEVHMKDWKVDKVSCKKSYSRTMLNAKLNSKNVKPVELDKISGDVYNNMFVPEYLHMGEPDDSGGTLGTKYFEVYFRQNLMGYIVTYTYYNSEGEWANQYIFKYNREGELLGELIETASLDYHTARMVGDPEWFTENLDSEIIDAILNAIDPFVSYEDEEGRSWSAHEIYATNYLSYAEDRGHYNFVVKVEAGMGHEYDESSQFSNDTCRVEVWIPIESTAVNYSFRIGKVEGCQVIQDNGEY